MIETVILIGGIFVGFVLLILKINKRYEKIYGKKNLRYDFDPQQQPINPANIGLSATVTIADE